jgi:hypothetical protein
MRRVVIPRCWSCKKVTLKTAAAAREHLAAMLRNKEKRGAFRKWGMHALTIYRCSHAHGWHIGRDPKILELNFSKGRVVNLEQREQKILKKMPKAPVRGRRKVS